MHNAPWTLVAEAASFGKPSWQLAPRTSGRAFSWVSEVATCCESRKTSGAVLAPACRALGRPPPLLLAAQGLLIATSLSRNAVTLDESRHLPVGLRYWDTGEFWAYHHNPPLTRLVFALPLVLADTSRVRSEVEYVPHDRSRYIVIAEDFRLLHRADYVQVFALARWMGIGFALLGGWVVFAWARDLFADAGGLFALALWTFCPFVLAHGGLVTPDVGAASLCVAGTYAFWRYLRAPTLGRVFGSAVLLGLAEAAKFSAVVLPPVWLLLACVRFGRREHVWGVRPRLAALSGHAVLLIVVSLCTLNSIYLWEGTGKPLGDFPLRGLSLTRESRGADDDEPRRVNRFRDTWLRTAPVPLPEHYLLGFDDQLWDMEQQGFTKYLRGELRPPDEPGWWYYYLYGLLVKWPLGTLALLAMSAVLACWSRYRVDLVTELALLLSPLVIIVSLSTKSALNSHVRYVLLALPFLLILAARVILWCRAGRGWRASLPPLLLTANIVSVIGVHPHYIAYFNEAVAGPRGGIRHPADSNLDWGQGLLALKEWLDEHAPGEAIRLAYFGGTEPRDVGIDYELLDPRDPRPGLHAISATLLAGVPNQVHDGRGGYTRFGDDVFRAYRNLRPIATPGYSIHVFDVTQGDVERLRQPQK